MNEKEKLLSKHEVWSKSIKILNIKNSKLKKKTLYASLNHIIIKRGYQHV